MRLLLFILLLLPLMAQQPVRKVKTATVESISSTLTPRYSGTIRSARRANLGFSLAARLAARPIEVGDQVQAGALLARLDTRQFENALAAARAQLAQAEAQFSQAQLEHERVKRLADAKAATLEELEAVNARRESILAAQNAARANLDEAQRLLSECSLRAPFAGTVAAVRLQVGEFAAPGIPVVTLLGESQLEVEIEVPESLAPSLKAGMKVQIELPLSSGKRLGGTIQATGRAATQESGRLYPVLIALEAAAGISAGMTAEVLIPVQSGSALAVPVAAVINPGGSRPTVLCVRDGKIAAVPVRVSQLVKNQVVIEGALAVGEAIVIGGHAGLIEGDAVEVSK